MVTVVGIGRVEAGFSKTPIETLSNMLGALTALYDACHRAYMARCTDAAVHEEEIV